VSIVLHFVVVRRQWNILFVDQVTMATLAGIKSVSITCQHSKWTGSSYQPTNWCKHSYKRENCHTKCKRCHVHARTIIPI